MAHGRDSPQPGPGLCRPRLAQVLPLVFVRGLPRSAARPLRAAARDQRGPGRAGRWFRHPRSPRHGDHQLRARGRARAQGLDWDQLNDPPRRRPADERWQRCAAQRVQRVAAAARALPADLDPAKRRRRSRGVRGKALRRGREARPSVSRGIARRSAGFRPHSPGRAGVCGAVRRSGTRPAASCARTPDLRSRSPRSHRCQRRGARGRRRTEAERRT